HGKRVLLVDLDPQGNATMGSGIDKSSLESNLYQVLIGESSIEQARVSSEAGGYDVLPAKRELAGAESELVNMGARQRQLRAAMATPPWEAASTRARSNPIFTKC